MKPPPQPRPGVRAPSSCWGLTDHTPRPGRPAHLSLTHVWVLSLAPGRQTLAPAQDTLFRWGGPGVLPHTRSCGHLIQRKRERGQMPAAALCVSFIVAGFKAPPPTILRLQLSGAGGIAGPAGAVLCSLASGRGFWSQHRPHSQPRGAACPSRSARVEGPVRMKPRGRASVRTCQRPAGLLMCKGRIRFKSRGRGRGTWKQSKGKK